MVLWWHLDTSILICCDKNRHPNIITLTAVILVLQRAMDRKIFIDKMTINSSKSDPGKFPNEKSWATRSEIFVNHLIIIPDTTCILVVYIIRSSSVPLFTATYSTFNEDIIAKSALQENIFNILVRCNIEP